MDSLLPKLIVGPKPAKAGFINGMIGRSREIPFKIMNQFVRFPGVG
jgi:hypothetical protein